MSTAMGHESSNDSHETVYSKPAFPSASDQQRSQSTSRLC